MPGAAVYQRQTSVHLNYGRNDIAGTSFTAQKSFALSRRPAVASRTDLAFMRPT
jgi:hypothetical protein